MRWDQRDQAKFRELTKALENLDRPIGPLTQSKTNVVERDDSTRSGADFDHGINRLMGVLPVVYVNTTLRALFAGYGRPLAMIVRDGL